MKKTLNSLSVGEKLSAKVVEIIGENNLIISLYGDLVRVKNKSRKVIKVGDIASLMVISLHPLKFKLAGSSDILGISVRV